jgi:large repetitive protein
MRSKARGNYTSMTTMRFLFALLLLSICQPIWAQTPAVQIQATCPAEGAILNVPYSFTITAQNNTGLPLAWTGESSFPPGLGMNSSTGEISGTPTGTGTFPVSINVGNSGGSATYNCDIVVSLPLVITASCPAPTGVPGAGYSFAITVSGGQGQPLWTSIGGPLPPGLSLNSSTGVISGLPTSPGSYPISIQVSDGFFKPQTATYNCTIVISTPLTITAGCPATVGVPGTPYSFTVSAIGGQNPLTWALVSGALPPGLGLNSATGVISGTPTTIGTYPITVQVSDSGPPSFRQGATYTCSIVITNQLTITALCPAPSGIPNVPYSFTISVIGGRAPYTWSLTSGPLPPGLSLNPQTGQIAGFPLTPGTYPITVKVTDSTGSIPSESTGPLTATYTCSIVIATQLTLTALCPAPVGSPGVSYSFAITVAGGNAPYTWALTTGNLPPGLTLNTQTGIISGTPTTGGTYPISVAVTDTASESSTPQRVTYTCSIVISSLTITATCPAALQLGVPFSLTITTTGGLPPLLWTLTSGTLPPGLTLNSATGLISGMPTVPGSYPITVTVSDGSPVTSSTPRPQYTCTFVVSTPPLTITATCPGPVPVNVAFSLTITAAGGFGSRTWTLTSGSLPAGLNLDRTTGIVSGTPTVPGNYPIAITVSDSSTGSGPAPVYSCSIVVTPAALRITATCPAGGLSAFQGTAFSFAVTATGGIAPLSWTPSASLPAGLTLNSQTGVISGMPTGPPGTFPLNVAVKDSGTGSLAQSPVTFACNVVVTSSLVITTGCPLPTVRTGNSLSSVLLTATGGTGNYTFSVSGATPAGLSVSGNTVGGQITASQGSYVFNLQVSDGQQTVQKSCSMNVAPPAFQITGSCPASPITQGTPFTSSLTSTGGVGDAGWQVTLGSLPAGLTLAGSTVSGTPTGPPGTSTFTLQASSGDQIGTLNCTLVVNPPKLLFTGSCPGNGTQGVAYGPFTLSATGGLGAGTYTFSVTSGSLPGGVALSGNTIGGTPTAPSGTSNFQLSVASGTQTATGPACTVTIAPPPLQITGNCPAGPSVVGGQVSLSTSVVGGKAPYSFTLSGAPFLSLSTAASGATATGTPTDPGSFPVSITVTDSAQSAPATFSCTLAVNPAPLTLGGSCPVNPIFAAAPVSFLLTATGGKAPYGWSLSGTSGLSLASAAGSSNTVSGNAPADPGDYSLSITLSDSMNSQPATLSCPLTVQLPPLKITGTCPASTLDVPVNISVPLTATGGKQPYSWSFTGPSWLSASPATGPTTTVAVSGTPASSGPFTFAVTLTDGANSTPASFSCNSTINPPPIPAISVTGLTPPATLFAPVSVSLQLAAPTPLPLTGVVQLSFVPNAFGETDNPQVIFDGRDATTAGRQFAFTVPAGGTAIPLPNIQQGTVAGTVHVEVTVLMEGTRDVLPSPHPFRELVIAKQVPIVAATDVSFTNETATGFDIVISGFSTPRDMKSVALVFTAQDGATLDGTTTFTTDVSAQFAQYYSTHLNAGSMFTSLDIPVTITGDKTAIQSVKITLTNSVGDSTPITKTR